MSVGTSPEVARDIDRADRAPARRPPPMQIALRGRIERPPELRTAKNGHPYAAFSLAVDDEGRTEFVSCTIFDGIDELPPLKRGQLVRAAGRLRVRRYRTESGAPACSLNVTLQHLLVEDAA